MNPIPQFSGLEAAALPPAPASASDAELFERLRRDLAFPREVTYCNTGTLGAVRSWRDVFGR